MRCVCVSFVLLLGGFVTHSYREKHVVHALHLASARALRIGAQHTNNQYAYIIKHHLADKACGDRTGTLANFSASAGGRILHTLRSSARLRNRPQKAHSQKYTAKKRRAHVCLITSSHSQKVPAKSSKRWCWSVEWRGDKSQQNRTIVVVQFFSSSFRQTHKPDGVCGFVLVFVRSLFTLPLVFACTQNCQLLAVDAQVHTPPFSLPADRRDTTARKGEGGTR